MGLLSLAHNDGDFVFPQILFRILNEATERGFDHIIRWNEPHGRSFRIIHRDRLVDDVLVLYGLRQSHFKSFVRQLNLWGFQCIHGGRKNPEKGSYHHHLFDRQHPEKLGQMQRIRVKGRRGRSSNGVHPPAPRTLVDVTVATTTAPESANGMPIPTAVPSADVWTMPAPTPTSNVLSSVSCNTNNNNKPASIDELSACVHEYLTRLQQQPQSQSKSQPVAIEPLLPEPPTTTTTTTGVRSTSPSPDVLAPTRVSDTDLCAMEAIMCPDPLVELTEMLHAQDQTVSSSNTNTTFCEPLQLPFEDWKVGDVDAEDNASVLLQGSSEAMPLTFV